MRTDSRPSTAACCTLCRAHTLACRASLPASWLSVCCSLASVGSLVPDAGNAWLPLLGCCSQFGDAFGPSVAVVMKINSSRCILTVAARQPISVASNATQPPHHPTAPLCSRRLSSGISLIPAFHHRSLQQLPLECPGAAPPSPRPRTAEEQRQRQQQQQWRLRRRRMGRGRRSEWCCSGCCCCCCCCCCGSSSVYGTRTTPALCHHCCHHCCHSTDGCSGSLVEEGYGQEGEGDGGEEEGLEGGLAGREATRSAAVAVVSGDVLLTPRVAVHAVSGLLRWRGSECRPACLARCRCPQ